MGPTETNNFCWIIIEIDKSANQQRIILLSQHIIAMLQSQQQQQNELKQFIQQEFKNKENINLSVVYQKPIFSHGARVLANIIDWSIVIINLNMYKLGDQGMQQLIRVGPRWGALRKMSIQKNEISSEGLKGIAQAGWKEMRNFQIGKNKIKHEGLLEISKANWQHLEILHLQHCEVGAEGAKIIKQANWKLISLHLNYNFIQNQGMKYLSLCDFSRTECMELNNNRIDAKGIYFLQQIDMPKLTYLALNQNSIGKYNDQISQIGCIHLSKLRVTGIKSLHLFGNQITLEGIRIILYETKLVENCFLELIRNHFSHGDIIKDITKLKLFCNYFD